MKKNITTIAPFLLFLFSILLLLLCRNAHAQPYAKSYWLNYAKSLNIKNGGLSVINAHGLFPDTAVNALTYNSQFFYSPTANKIYMHAIGNVLDISSPVYKSIDGVDTSFSNHPYEIDSIGVGYLYFRNHPNASIVDTMLVYLYDNNIATDLVAQTY